MKVSNLVAVVAVSVGVVASAQPHHHQHHHHAQKRAPTQVTDVIEVPGPTVWIYELNGAVIPSDEVQEGIKNGSLVWATGSSSSIFSAPATSAVEHRVTTHTTPIITETPTSSAKEIPTTTTTSTSSTATSIEVVSLASSSTTTTKAAAPTTTQAATTQASSSSSGSNADFPDGQLSCSTFPSAYGAVALDYLGLGGWAGIQTPRSVAAAGFSNILTATTNTCSGGNCCTEGSFCSYACAPGYQKSQWPTMQGSTGQSIGGIQCKNGKLHLTNPAMSNSLCMPGTTKVNLMVKNTMNKNAAVCRTDYPGTEGETIPLNAQPGTTTNLTCPEGNNYYMWNNKPTSAQYYVNPAGVSTAQGCQWGSPDQDYGNYAPMNLGVGYSNGAAYLSIFQNLPTTSAKLNFNVEIVGDNGGFENLSNRCRYQNGQYCSGANYQTCTTTGGCTVSVSSGTATYVFSS